MKRILLLGAGFSGLWSAVGAARKLDELKVGPNDVEVTLVNRDAWHDIRVRNYESDLSHVRVPLHDVLDPIGVRLVEGEVTDFDLGTRKVSINTVDGARALPYDRMVFALGSHLVRPAIRGLAEYAFDVDTWAGGQRLNEHIAALPTRRASPGQYTVLVVGSGLTGCEAATEAVGKLQATVEHAGLKGKVHLRVIIADHSPHIGSNMGESAVPVILEALKALGIEARTGVSVTAIDRNGATLAPDGHIDAATVVWCTGMHASRLTEKFPVERDHFGRVPVDAFLRVKGVDGVFAAGDVAWFEISKGHDNVMSCQHGRPMGRYAGHNVVCNLLGKPMLPLRIDWYTTILDLGAWGAVYTEGWDRQVATTGQAAKQTKRTINRERIYPPLTRNRADILAEAAPVVQAPPQKHETAKDAAFVR
ncbi:MAG: NAD(P)/FAD-dependent oxidoreductase [Rhodanobacteraceae bacterium]